jgi:NAD(P)-dependent dehydrogenase (short-subunit alcohol dehydrogenase family)
MGDLQDKEVLITGANGALGSAVADKARALGGNLVLLDLKIPEKPLQGDRWFEVDLGDEAAVNSAASEIASVDVMFHVAGGFDMGPTVYDLSKDSLDHLFKMNVTTFHNLARAFIPGMVKRGKGSVVTIGALGAVIGLANMGAYGVAKSSLLRLTESLSAEVKDKGINVNCVLPSIIDTPANRRDMPDADHASWVSANDLANVICFLGSESARAVHGASIPVSGLV